MCKIVALQVDLSFVVPGRDLLPAVFFFYQAFFSADWSPTGRYPLLFPVLTLEINRSKSPSKHKLQGILKNEKAFIAKYPDFHQLFISAFYTLTCRGLTPMVLEIGCQEGKNGI